MKTPWCRRLVREVSLAQRSTSPPTSRFRRNLRCGRWKMLSSRLTSPASRSECGSGITRITPRTCAAIWRASRCYGWWTRNAGTDKIRVLGILVPKKGLEPPHPCGYMDLNHARLPIPPLRHEWKRVLTINSLFRKQEYSTGARAELAIAIRLSLFAFRHKNFRTAGEAHSEKPRAEPQLAVSAASLALCAPYSFNLLCSVFRLMPRI